MTLERCSECDEPTGRAGVHDDSLFLETPLDALGPYCLECYESVQEDICGLCGEGGADKVPHPHYWPNEERPTTDIVHALCEQEECRRAHAELTEDQLRAALESIRAR